MRYRKKSVIARPHGSTTNEGFHLTPCIIKARAALNLWLHAIAVAFTTVSTYCHLKTEGIPKDV